MTDSAISATTPAEMSPPAGEPVLPAGIVKQGLLIFVLAALLIDGLPRTCDLHRWAARRIRPVLAPLALYQPTWKLFAPSPSHSNSFVTARLTTADGQVHTWEPPKWAEMNAWEKFQNCRHIKYYLYLQDWIGEERGNPLWSPFADYVARAQASRGKRVVKVELIRHFQEIPPPSSQWRPYRQPRGEFESKQFFSKEYP